MTPEEKASRYVRQLQEYRITSQECWQLPAEAEVIKADWNEAGAPPSPKVLRALTDFITGRPLHWYPDVEAGALRQALCQYTGVESEAIQVFSGSDAALEYLARAFINPGDQVVFRVPTYDNFRVYVQSAGAKVIGVTGRDPFTVDWPPLLAAVTNRTKLVYLVNPDNPTGVTYTPSQIRSVARRASGGLVVVDEAYFEFYGQSAASLIKTLPNVVVSRSFSKAFGLAGLRCGYLLADPRVLAVINKIRVGKNVGSLAQVAALAALEDRPHMDRYVEEVKAAKAWLIEQLTALGVKAIDTPANFISLQVDQPTALVSHLKTHRIYVRDRSYLPQLERSVRVTIGTHDQVKTLLAAIEDFLDVERFLDV